MATSFHHAVRAARLSPPAGVISHAMTFLPPRPRPGLSLPFLAWLLLAGGLVAADAGALSAQESAEDSAQEVSPDWEVEGELGGSFYFGNRDQAHFSVRSQMEREGALLETSTELRFTYGRSTDEEGVSSVHRRSWLAGTSLDFRPDDTWRPFVSGRIQSSFERRIALRYDVGAGLKVDVRTDRRNRVDLSVSILAERTYAREGGSGTPDEVSLARWSSDLRVRRTYVDDRLGVDLRASYRPVFDVLGNYTVSSRNAFSYDLTEVVAVRFSVITEYDSRAIERGARTSRDGQVEVSLVARF